MRQSYTHCVIEHRIHKANEREAAATHELVVQANRRLLEARRAASEAVVANLRSFGDVHAPDRVLVALSRALSQIGEANELLVRIHDRMVGTWSKGPKK